MIRDGQKAGVAAKNTGDALKGAGDAAGKTAPKLKETARAAREVAGSSDSASKALSGLSKALAAYLSLQTLKYLADLSDGYQQNASRIRNATKSAEEYEHVQNRLLATANGTYRSLGEAQEVFLSVSGTLQQMGYSLDDVLDISDSLSYAFVRDAARADQATSAMDAYSKSLAKGRVDADAWASMIAASGSIIENVAKATGRTSLEIQKLGAEGKLSMQALNEGLRQSLDDNQAAADSMAVSTRDATVQMRNALTRFVGKVNEASGASNVFTENVGKLAKMLQDPETINAAVDLAGGIVTALNTIISGMKTTVNIARWFGEEMAAAFGGIAPDDIVRLEDENKLLQERVDVLKKGGVRGTIVGLMFDLDEEESKLNRNKQQIEEYWEWRKREGQRPPEEKPPSGEIPLPNRIVPAEAPNRSKSGGRSNGEGDAKKRLKEELQLQKQQAETAARYLIGLQERVGEVDKLTNSERLYYDIAAGAVKLQGSELEQARALAQTLDERESSRRAEADALNIVNAELSAQRQLLSEIAGYDADIDGAGMGERARSEMEARLQIVQQFAQRVQQIDDQRRQALAQADEKDRERIRQMYDDVLRIEQDYQGKSLAAYDQYVQRKREADADWTTGASRAWANYVEQSQSAAATAEGAMQSWLSSTEDALTQFVQTGKLSFSDLANSIIADLARIAARQAVMGAVGSMMGGWLGTAIANQSSDPIGSFIKLNNGFASVPGRANGGPVAAGQMYEVNERGIPELLTYGGKQYLMMGNQSGNVTPMGGSAGGGIGSLKVIIENKGQAMEATGARLESNGMEQVLRVFVQQEIRKEAQNLAGGRGSIDQALKSRYAMTPRR